MVGAGKRSQATGAGSDKWLHARLIPSYGIRSQEEQEKRATSCLLAVMHGVPEFGHALLRDLGAPKSPAIETFAEVRFKRSDGGLDIPDGAIVCERGGKRWTCLVEVKTGAAMLKAEQVGRYLEIAREHDLDGVLTISSQITHNSSESPIDVDGRKLRKTGLWHLSWWRIMTEAVVQSRYRGVSDPDQAWVLRELIHYLGTDASGAVGFEDMGKNWVPVRTSAHDGTLRQGDPEVREIAERWEQFSDYLCLSLSQELGRDVRSIRPRSQSTSARLDEVVKSLATDGALETAIRVPDAVGDIRVRADLKSRQTSVSVEVLAPTEGRVKSRINWLLRQLDDASPDLRIEVWYPRARQSVADTLARARERPEALYFPGDPAREPRSFVLTVSRSLGQKRGRAEGSFVRETRSQVVAFYRDLVQSLKTWQARAPQIREKLAPDGSVAPSLPDLLPLKSAEEMLSLTAGPSDSKDGSSADDAGQSSAPAGTELDETVSALANTDQTQPDLPSTIS